MTDENQGATENNQALVKKEKTPILADERGVKLRSLEDLWRFATAVVHSRVYKDLETPEIAVVKIQAGMELGLTPIWALSNIFVVSGRPAVFGDALLGLVLSHKDCEDVIETTDGVGDQLTAICEVRRKGRIPVIRSFSTSDAKRSGLWGKAGPWSSYPARMLQMRARSFACRDAFADVLRGLSVVEEVADITEREPVKPTEKPVLVLPDEVEVSV